MCKVNFLYQWVLYTHYNTYSYCDSRYKIMLVCLHPGIFVFVFFFECTVYSEFLDGEGSINTYLLNLIFNLFTLLHFVCLVLLECTSYHYELTLLKSTQSAISWLAAPWNLVPTALFFVYPCGCDDGATIHWRGRSKAIWVFTFS